MPFILPNQTSFAQIKPDYSGSTWVRPVDWVSITDTPNEVQFLVSSVVFPVYALRTTFTKPTTENLYIDWGDGVIDTISTATSTTTNHTYTGGTGTPCSRGYDTWKVRVYVDAGAQITECINVRPNYYVLQNLRGSSGLLEEYYGDGTIITAQALHSIEGTNTPRFFNLEYSKLPSVMNGSGTIFAATYSLCQSLAKVVLPTSASGATAMNEMFDSCYVIQEISFPSYMPSITNMTSTFSNCHALSKLTLPTNLDNLSVIQTTFSNCYSLGIINLPPTPKGEIWNSAFNNCRSLLSLEIKSFPQNRPIDMGSAFQNAYSLESVKLANFGSGTTQTMTSLFTNCHSLKTFVFPQNTNTGSLASAFSNCYSLAQLTLPTSLPTLTSLISTFVNTYALSELTLPTNYGASVSLQNTFNGTGLSEIIYPSGLTPSDMANTHQNALSLRKVVLPPTAPSNSSNFFSGCFSLQEVQFFTNLTNATNLQNIFLNCRGLTGLTMPSVANSVNTMSGAFQGCGNLLQITLPTSMTGCPNWANTFNGCSTLRSCVLPATATASITTFAGTFTNCFSLLNITLPNTQMTSLTTINAMVDTCISLTGITNTDKLGNPSTAAIVFVDGTNFARYNQISSLDLYTKFSKFVAIGGNVSAPSPLTSLRLRNNGAAQYGGLSPQIDIRFNSLGQAALVQVFNDLPTITSKTINITSNPGAALLTAGERAIATGKGWTIVG